MRGMPRVMTGTYVGRGGAFTDTDLQDTKVAVTSLMPGPTDTKFVHRAGMDDTKVQGFASKVLPDKLKAAAHRQMARARVRG
jgi:short-subunit dehydrogenase